MKNLLVSQQMRTRKWGDKKCSTVHGVPDRRIVNQTPSIFVLAWTGWEVFASKQGYKCRFAHQMISDDNTPRQTLQVRFQFGGVKSKDVVLDAMHESLISLLRPRG